MLALMLLKMMFFCFADFSRAAPEKRIIFKSQNNELAVAGSHKNLASINATLFFPVTPMVLQSL